MLSFANWYHLLKKSWFKQRESLNAWIHWISQIIIMFSKLEWELEGLSILGRFQNLPNIKTHFWIFNISNVTSLELDPREKPQPQDLDVHFLSESILYLGPHGKQKHAYMFPIDSPNGGLSMRKTKKTSLSKPRFSLYTQDISDVITVSPFNGSE